VDFVTLTCSESSFSIVWSGNVVVIPVCVCGDRRALIVPLLVLITNNVTLKVMSWNSEDAFTSDLCMFDDVIVLDGLHNP
jgi:hypothetical protein